MNPDMSNDVSKRSQIKSLTILSILAAAAFDDILGHEGVLWVDLHGRLGRDVISHGVLRTACAFMVVNMHGDPMLVH